MNKTVKTIAWICLVLGLLGVAADAVIVVRAQTYRANIADRIESGEIPSPRGQSADKDNDSNSNKDEKKSELGREQNQNTPLGERWGGIGGRMPFNNVSGLASGRMPGLRSSLFCAAVGPILAVVGAVTLIVNREPKEEEPKEKKATTKEKTQKN